MAAKYDWGDGKGKVSLSGGWTWAIPAKSKSPDAAWRLLELLADEPNNLRFAQRYDRIPIRVRTAESPTFHQNDPFTKLAVEEMRERRILIPAPGGNELLALTERVAIDAMSGKQSVRATLSDVQTQMQQVLDKYKR